MTMTRKVMKGFLNKLFETGKITVSYETFEYMVKEFKYIEKVDFSIEIKGARVTIQTQEGDYND